MNIEINKKIIEILGKNGFDINNLEDNQELDSLTFISCIVDLESEFSIEIPDELLVVNLFEDIDKLTNIIIDLTNKECVSVQ